MTKIAHKIYVKVMNKMVLELYQYEADRLQTLGICGNKNGKRWTNISPKTILAVKNLLAKRRTHDQIIMEIPISSKTITKIKRGELDNFITK